MAMDPLSWTHANANRRICTGCKRDLPMHQFSLDCKGPGGRNTRCKSCRKSHGRHQYDMDALLKRCAEECVAGWGVSPSLAKKMVRGILTRNPVSAREIMQHESA